MTLLKQKEGALFTWWNETTENGRSHRVVLTMLNNVPAWLFWVEIQIIGVMLLLSKNDIPISNFPPAPRTKQEQQPCKIMS